MLNPSYLPGLIVCKLFSSNLNWKPKTATIERFGSISFPRRLELEILAIQREKIIGKKLILHSLIFIILWPLTRTIFRKIKITVLSSSIHKTTFHSQVQSIPLPHSLKNYSTTTHTKNSAFCFELFHTSCFSKPHMYLNSDNEIQ